MAEYHNTGNLTGSIININSTLSNFSQGVGAPGNLIDRMRKLTTAIATGMGGLGGEYFSDRVGERGRFNEFIITLCHLPDLAAGGKIDSAAAILFLQAVRDLVTQMTDSVAAGKVNRNLYNLYLGDYQEALENLPQGLLDRCGGPNPEEFLGMVKTWFINALNGLGF